MTHTGLDNLLDRVAVRADKADVFEVVRRAGDELVCAAGGSSAPAEYAVTFDVDHRTIWIALRTADRWLSESIEAALMHTGDKLEELIEDELAELNCPMPVRVEHFRDDNLCYTFRSPVRLATDQVADDTELIAKTGAYLLAYEAAFRKLGDMSSGQS